jgi:RNA polymerase sigma-70 factor (ECF subfamily)
MKPRFTSDQISEFTGSLLKAHEQLYYYALQLTENQDDAKDLVQETSYKALKNFTLLKNDEHKNAWLYTILRNTYINNLRSGHHRNIKMNKADQNLQIGAAVMPDFENPDRIFDRKELMEKIRCLPPSYARPLKLYISGYSYKEIAKMTDVPIGTIKSRIHLAKGRLRKQYISN